MAYATFDDLKQVEITIDEYGILEWDIELARSETEINRILKVRWYHAYQKAHPVLAGIDLDSTLLDPTQFTQACVYHALAYHIFPKLSKFEVDKDNFQVKMEYYQGRFEHEMDLILREGVRYDINDDNVISSSESAPVNSLRLVR